MSELLIYNIAVCDLDIAIAITFFQATGIFGFIFSYVATNKFVILQQLIVSVAVISPM